MTISNSYLRHATVCAKSNVEPGQFEVSTCGQYIYCHSAEENRAQFIHRELTEGRLRQQGEEFMEYLQTKIKEMPEIE